MAEKKSLLNSRKTFLVVCFCLLFVCREAFCTSPSKRLLRRDDSPLPSYCNLPVGDSEISSAAEPGGRFSTPVSTIDSEYTHTGVYVHHGAWTDDGANEDTLLNGGAGVEELELLEQPRVLYSRASYNTGEERTRDQHTENTFKKYRKKPCSQQNGNYYKYMSLTI